MRLTEPHAYKHGPMGGGACAACGLPPESSLHQFSLELDAPADRAAALAEEMGRRLTDKMRAPLRDITSTTGQIEMRSPLFAGSSANPHGLLF